MLCCIYHLSSIQFRPDFRLWPFCELIKAKLAVKLYILDVNSGEQYILNNFSYLFF